MKKYIVIGNPIDHSLSPELHNYWLEQNNISGIYDKEKLSVEKLKNFFLKIRNKEVSGANVTVPFKRDVIPYLDDLSIEARSTQSVNIIYLKDNKIMGHNTDIDGFKMAIKDTNYNVANKRVLILGAGGVVSSIIFALYKMKVTEISLCNRTRSKAENLKNLFKNLKIVDWGETSDPHIIINATSVGLKQEDKLDLDFSKFMNADLFYDVIYNPNETNFLKAAKSLGKKSENGKKMFIYQAAMSFKIWHSIEPKINDKVYELLDI
tara:strand:- start:265 stop:1059 length:795 start_codon:yes stop_codon:yes gene_type:complete